MGTVVISYFCRWGNWNLEKLNSLIRVIKPVSGRDEMRICLSDPEPLPFSVFGGGFSPGSGKGWKKGRCKPAAIICSWGGQGYALLGKSVVLAAGAEVCSERCLEAASKGARGRSWTASSFSGLRPSLWVSWMWILTQTYTLGRYCLTGFLALSAQELKPPLLVSS